MSVHKGEFIELRAWKTKREWNRFILGCWIVTGPFHLFWGYWVLSMIHLRTDDVFGPAKKNYPEAEYEFIIQALSPDHEPDPDNPRQTLVPLQPIDCIVQFHGVNDAQAEKVLENAVRLILEEKASPDTDFRSFWEGFIPANARHVAAGGCEHC